MRGAYTKYIEGRTVCTQCGGIVGLGELEYREIVGAWPTGQYLCGSCCDELDAVFGGTEEERFNQWVADNYTGQEAQELLDHHVQSGDYPSEFTDE